MRTSRHWQGGSGGSAGGVVGTLAAWTFAIALIFLPFLRERDSVGSEEGDFARNVEVDIPFEEDVADYEAELGAGLAQAIAEESEARFGLTSDALRDSGVVDFARLADGRRAYETHCIGCHGTIGDGAGSAARFLKPRPRNFRRGLFKFTSTDASSRPQRRDLFQTLTRGLAGSSMPGFRLLPEELRWDLVEYVRWLSMKGEFEQMMLDDAWENEEIPDAEDIADIILRRWNPENLRSIFPGAPETERDAESVARGRAIFTDPTKGSCFTCHGEGGRGDGPTSDSYTDDWGYPIRPRDLTAGTFRAGSEGVDLYRTISAGIKGTPMGSFEGALTPEEIWDLVHFIQSLAQPR